MIIKIHYKAIPISTNYRLPTHSLRSKTKNGTICDGDSPPNFVLSTRASLLLFFLYPTQETEQVQLRWSKWFVTSLFLTSTLQLLFKRFIFLLLNHFYFCFDGVSKDLIPNGRVHVAKGNWLHEKKKNSTGLFFCVVFLAKWTHVYPRADYTTDLNGYEGIDGDMMSENPVTAVYTDVCVFGRGDETRAWGWLSRRSRLHTKVPKRQHYQLAVVPTTQLESSVCDEHTARIEERGEMNRKALLTERNGEWGWVGGWDLEERYLISGWTWTSDSGRSAPMSEGVGEEWPLSLRRMETILI